MGTKSDESSALIKVEAANVVADETREEMMEGGREWLLEEMDLCLDPMCTLQMFNISG